MYSLCSKHTTLLCLLTPHLNTRLKLSMSFTRNHLQLIISPLPLLKLSERWRVELARDTSLLGSGSGHFQDGQK